MNNLDECLATGKCKEPSNTGDLATKRIDSSPFLIQKLPGYIGP